MKEIFTKAVVHDVRGGAFLGITKQHWMTIDKLEPGLLGMPALTNEHSMPSENGVAVCICR